MSSLKRFGISLESGLLERFDKMIGQKGYGNRSEAIRDLIRDALVRNEWENETGETIGTITIIYDHHARQITSNKTAKEHSHFHQIISTMQAAKCPMVCLKGHGDFLFGRCQLS